MHWKPAARAQRIALALERAQHAAALEHTRRMSPLDYNATFPRSSTPKAHVYDPARRNRTLCGEGSTTSPPVLAAVLHLPRCGVCSRLRGLYPTPASHDERMEG